MVKAGDSITMLHETNTSVYIYLSSESCYMTLKLLTVFDIIFPILLIHVKQGSQSVQFKSGVYDWLLNIYTSKICKSSVPTIYVKF